ncbi:tyrosine-type recombinase/integrase [Siccirubricoccus sp. G192]|uniref:tyrosine-type recombinase/integrase n=1 Tax=Siccirubricoccus sp. G192 TaxID=2849651 RepID=UPI001C2BFED0|nr:tyrosine-type recombinase/integrase [Siccirubricoccus sp. G192]MBV1800666.1 tyrosine-type recombinase/integrase [Siccirubricoccus sp. G192]
MTADSGDGGGEGRAGAAALVLDTRLFGDLVVPGGGARAEELRALAARAAVYATKARGEGTLRAYRSAWRGYAAWCHSLGREPLAGDPDILAMYVVKRADAGLRLASLRVHLAAIQAAHRLAGIALDLKDPRLAMVLEGVARTKGTRPGKRAAAATPDALRRMLAARPGADTALGARDRAMLLLGFGAALRRAELAALRLGEVVCESGRGVTVLVRRSKTDPRAAGQQVAVWANPAEPGFCAMAALEAWLGFRRRAADLTGGASDAERPLFCAVTKAGRPTGQGLSDKAVWRLVKQAAVDAGLPAPERFSGHSLRAGLATAAGEAGAGLADLMRQTRHRSTEVALGYLRPADLWRNNVTEKVFRTARKEDG